MCHKNQHEISINSNSLANLLMHGDIKEKFRFVNNPTKKFMFENTTPIGTALLEAASAQQKGGCPVCTAWSSQQVCVPKQVCNNVCDAGAVTCVAVTGGSPICSAGAPICHLICNNTSECHDVPYCTNWDTEII